MTEEANNNDTLSLDKETRKVRVLLDPSPTVVSKDAEIARLNQELGKMQEINKALLAQDAERERIKAIRKNEPAPPPNTGETALLTNEPNYRQTAMQIEPDSIPIEFIKGKDIPEVLTITKGLAQKGNKDAQKALNTITKRSLKQGIDFQYEGNALLFNKRPYVISEFDSSEVKEAKQAFNAKWLKNRVAFRDMRGEDV